MKNLKKIDTNSFDPKIFEFFSKQWLLLTGGDFAANEFNSMTVAWGFLGTMWNSPCVSLVVRPQRKTLELLRKYDTFTCCAFPEEFRKDLAFLGKVSGYENPAKLSETSLTPTAAVSVEAPAFKEASLIIEGKIKMISPTAGKNFRDKKIPSQFYPDGDYHYIVIGEIINIFSAD